MGSKVKEDERKEKIIRGLLKLPGNRRCINCNSLGPQYVCTSYSTFICTNCSGIHREFTHRVKSISMAKFTSQEVSALQEGGNERAKEIYFKHWDFQGPVIDSSDLYRLRTFIKNVYVERRYTDQRIGEHLPQAKGNQDSHGNSNADSSRGVLRSAYVGTHEDNHDSKHSTKSPSEDRNNSNGHPVGSTVDKNNRSTMVREKANFRSPLHPDDLLKTGGKSENIPKVVGSPSSVLHKETNSNKKSTSSRTDDPNPATLQDAKLYVSHNLIDFDSDLEAPQGVAQTDIQKDSLPPTDVGWATFDVATPKTTANMPSSFSTIALEGPMLQIPDLASTPKIRFPNAPLSSPPAKYGSQQHQHYLYPVNTIQYNNTLLNRATSAPVYSQLRRAASPAPTTHGGTVLPANQSSNILIGIHDPAIVSSTSHQLAAEAASNVRKALPEDIFSTSYHPVSSAWNWQTNPHINMQYGQCHTHDPVGIVNFPSLTSVQEALPSMGSTTLLSRAPDQYMVQQHAVQVQNNSFPSGYERIRITTTDATYGIPPMDERLVAQNLHAMNHSSLPRVGGNPFA